MNRAILFLLPALACIVVAPVTAFAIADGNFLILAVIAAVSICLPLVFMPQALLFLSLVFWFSGLLIPHQSGKLTAFVALVPLICVVPVSRLIFQMETDFRWNSSRTWLLLFLLSFAPVIAVHGIGFQMLGGASWGGFSYVQLFTAAAFLFCMPFFSMPKSMWTVGIMAFAALSVLPAMADALAAIGRLPDFVRIFVQLASQIEWSQIAHETGQGVVRIYSLSPFALACLIAVYSRWDIRLHHVANKTLFLVVTGCAALVSFPSGNRLFTVQIVLFALAILLLTKTFDHGILARLLIAGAVGYAAIIIFAPYLPSGAQRTVSFLPFVEVDAAVSGDANDSIFWRIELWGEALKTLPDYWLIGKGFVFTGVQMERLIYYQYTDPLAWALLASAYHNGHLSLLLGVGVFGYITGMGVMISFLIRHWKIMNARWMDADLQRYHLIFYAYYVVQVFSYIFFYGDVIGSFATMFCTLGFAEAMRTSDAASKFSPLVSGDSSYSAINNEHESLV